MTNLVMGVGTFTGTKPVGTMPTKLTEEDELKRKDLELKRLMEKEEEAARKREELMKAKAEEQKRCVHFFPCSSPLLMFPFIILYFLKF